MMKHSPRSWPALALAVALGVLIGITGSSVFDVLQRDVGSPPETSSLGLGPVLSRLDAIEMAVQAHTTSAVREAPENVVRHDLGWQQQVLERLKVMEDHLASAGQASGLADSVVLWQTRRANPEQKRLVVDGFERRLKKDSGVARELLALPIVAVLERFGAPIEIIPNDDKGVMCWIYAPAMGADGRYLYISFRDGVVVRAKS